MNGILLAVSVASQQEDGRGSDCAERLHAVVVRDGLPPERYELNDADGENEASLEPLRRAAAEGATWISDDGAAVTDALTGYGLISRPADVIDTHALARMLLPCSQGPGAAGLAERSEAACPAAESGDARCDAVVDLWRVLSEKAASLPLPVLVEINQVLCFERHLPQRRFFLEAEKQARTRNPAASRDRLTDLLASSNYPKPREAPGEDDEWQPVDPERVCDLLGPTGPFARAFESYEYREGQVQMAREVAQSLNGSKHLLVEAGTGIGKSLAYLVPAVLWARTNDVPVVISTNTKNLQAQLMEKDLPLIRQIMDVDFKSALIKGRMNYLCLRKLFHVLRQSENELESDQEKLLLVNALVWVAETQSGDLSEMASLGRRVVASLAAKLTSTGEECLGRSCPHWRRCFLWRARARAQAADIIVANHSLVFAELNMKSPALPPYAHIVFDEAHNIEDVATRHLAVEVSGARIRFPLQRLWRTGRGRKRRGSGLAAAIRGQLESGSFTGDAEIRAQAGQLCDAITAGVAGVEKSMSPFFKALGTLLPDGRRESVRLRPESRNPAAWQTVLTAKETLVSAIAALKQSVSALSELFKAMETGGLAFHMETVRDLDAMVLWFTEVSSDMDFVLMAENPEHVYWVESSGPRSTDVRAWAAPVAVGRKLCDELYRRKQTIVFSSATLTVGGSYAFLKKRLGLHLLEPERMVELNAGSPFDYPNQCAVLVPTFLPDPGGGADTYAGETGAFLADVFRLTRGRALVLFTSYDMLRRTTDAVTEGLRGSGIRILVQGTSGSRESITNHFKHDLESVLMGTHSFWEGVDLVGETLSCLVVARLPFAVYTDPIHEARCERVEAEGESPFFGYSLPSAVIRLRQGFGRLIRHRNDRGIVIITDKRIVTKRYGVWFQRSLPVPTVPLATRDVSRAAIRRFLEEVQSV